MNGRREGLEYDCNITMVEVFQLIFFNFSSPSPSRVAFTMELADMTHARQS